MDLRRFADSPVGYLVDIAGTDPRTGVPFAHKAFVPNPLPDTIELDRATVNSIASAMHALGRLDQALNWISDPMLYIRPAIRREAVSTSALEGTFAAFEDVMGADMFDEKAADRDLFEVLNFVRAAEEAIKWVDERPITRSLICELQRILVRNTESDGLDTGQIRTTHVIIGPRGASVDEARFVPPPPGDALTAGVRDWEEWVERQDEIPPLARIALSHYQFETLHPFADGNGRIGRLIALLQLVRYGILARPMVNISTWLYDHREEYVDHLLRISAEGIFDPWIQFFCEAVSQEASAAVKRIEDAQKWRESVMLKIRQAGIRASTVHHIADGLIGHPVFSPTWVQHRYNVSYPTANSAIRRLESLGIVSEMTGRNYARLYAANQLLQIFGTGSRRPTGGRRG